MEPFCLNIVSPISLGMMIEPGYLAPVSAESVSAPGVFLQLHEEPSNVSTSRPDLDPSAGYTDTERGLVLDIGVVEIGSGPHDSVLTEMR